MLLFLVYFVLVLVGLAVVLACLIQQKPYPSMIPKITMCFLRKKHL